MLGVLRPLLAATALLLLPLVATAQENEAAGAGAITGRVVLSAGAGVDGAIVRLPELGLRAVTDPRGLFHFMAIPPGTYRVDVSHPLHGSWHGPMTVERGEMLTVRVVLSEDGISLEPLIVRVRPRAEAARRVRGTATHEVNRADIQAAPPGSSVAEILSQQIPTATIRRETFLAGAPECLEFRGARALDDGICRPPRVVVDGVAVADPVHLLGTLDPGMIERMELLSPAEAGVLYGGGAARGVLVVETRLRPPPGPQDANLDPFGWRWEMEEAGHATTRVLASTFAASTAGLGLGVLLARTCFDRVSHGSFHSYQSDCGDLGTMGVGVTAAVLPVLGSTLMGRWAGATDTSHGQFLPPILAGTALSVAGFALVASRQWDGDRSYEIIGFTLMGIGLPLVTTFTDRVFRELR